MQPFADFLSVSPGLLTVREVARLLKVSTATVYRLVSRGDLHHLRVSNAIRVDRDDLYAFLSGGKGRSQCPNCSCGPSCALAAGGLDGADGRLPIADEPPGRWSALWGLISRAVQRREIERASGLQDGEHLVLHALGPLLEQFPDLWGGIRGCLRSLSHRGHHSLTHGCRTELAAAGSSPSSAASSTACPSHRASA